MRIITSAVAMLLLGGAALAKPEDIRFTLLQDLKRAAKCDDPASPWRPWCIAAEYPNGTDGELPRGKVLVGLSIALVKNQDVGQALSDKVTFAAFAVGADGKVKLTEIKPTSPDEQKAVGEAVMAVALVFKDKAKTAKLPKALADYLKTLTGSYETKRDAPARTWHWQGTSSAMMRKVGTFWVIIEGEPSGPGIYATILTEAWDS